MKKGLLFVDDERMVLGGLKRLTFPLREQWDMHFAESGEEALKIMESGAIDVIVSDLRMPGMEGTRLLKEVQKLHPHIIRIVLTGEPDREYTASHIVPVHQYLVKPCDFDTIKGVLAKIVSLDQIDLNARLKAIISRLSTLPVLPEVFTLIEKELDKENPSPDAVAEAVSQDVGLTAKLLSLVNSPYFGYHKKIVDPRYAVMVLGMDFIRSMLLGCHIFAKYEDQKVAGFSLALLWEHSLRVANHAKRIATFEKASPDIETCAFLGGLLHDVGKLLLAVYFKHEYNAVLSQVRKENRRVEAVEREHFGVSHAEVGAYLMGIWGLHPEVIGAISLHHCPQSLDSRISAAHFVFAANLDDHHSTIIHPAYALPDIPEAWLREKGLFEKFQQWSELSGKPLEHGA